MMRCNVSVMPMIPTPVNRPAPVRWVVRHGMCAAALSSLLVAGCNSSSPAPQNAPAATPVPAQPPGNPSGPRIYVSDETGRDVVVLDPDSGREVGRIEVGKRPRGLRLTRDGKQLMIALSGSPIGGPGVDESKLPPADRAADGIGVVDVATGKLVRKFNSGQDPESFDISPDGKFLYVSNEDAAEMSVVDLSSGTISARVKVGEEPEGVTVRPDGRVVYVSCEADNEIVAVDTATLKVVARVKTEPRPRSIVFVPDSTVAFVGLGERQCRRRHRRDEAQGAHCHQDSTHRWDADPAAADGYRPVARWQPGVRVVRAGQVDWRDRRQDPQGGPDHRGCR